MLIDFCSKGKQHQKLDFVYAFLLILNRHVLISSFTSYPTFSGRKCVVIGASYGIGRRTADILASQGALVVYASGSRRKLVDCVEEEEDQTAAEAPCGQSSLAEVVRQQRGGSRKMAVVVLCR